MRAAVLDDIEIAAFRRDGFLIRRNMASDDLCKELLNTANSHMEQHLAPIEYEVEVQYPGAPVNAEAEGADTSRRLLQAYSRHEVFRRWATSPIVNELLQELLISESVQLSQCHHNCIMTKRPGYSSATLWHQDNRYWSFDEENLVSVWLALGNEGRHNGGLRVIPGSHLLDYAPGRFDAALFLRSDISENKALIAEAIDVELTAGDVLFFHSRLFHAAGRNRSDKTKYSLVFTYHDAGNLPIEGTRSARYPSIDLQPGVNPIR